MTTRRNFLAGLTAGAAMIAGAAHATTKVPQKWDEEVDVIVIVAGFAGLAADIEATKAGASVLVLEKMGTTGGNSAINGGLLCATGCPQQLKHG